MSVTKAIRAGEIDAPRQFAQFANRFRPITQLVRFEIERFQFWKYRNLSFSKGRSPRQGFENLQAIETELEFDEIGQ